MTPTREYTAVLIQHRITAAKELLVHPERMAREKDEAEAKLRQCGRIEALRRSLTLVHPAGEQASLRWSLECGEHEARHLRDVALLETPAERNHRTYLSGVLSGWVTAVACHAVAAETLSADQRNGEQL